MTGTSHHAPGHDTPRNRIGLMPVTRCLECHVIGDWGRAGRCTTHRLRKARVKDRTPARQAMKRKYNAEHRKARRWWADLIPTGHCLCWRCGHQIGVNDVWHLGHVDQGDSPSLPEHASCNLTNSNEGKTKYNAEHRKARRWWADLIPSDVPVIFVDPSTGHCLCWRCGHQIGVNDVWHLGHVDQGDSPSLPEHASCNLTNSNEGKTA